MVNLILQYDVPKDKVHSIGAIGTVIDVYNENLPPSQMPFEYRLFPAEKHGKGMIYQLELQGGSYEQLEHFIDRIITAGFIRTNVKPPNKLKKRFPSKEMRLAQETIDRKVSDLDSQVNRRKE